MTLADILNDMALEPLDVPDLLFNGSLRLSCADETFFPFDFPVKVYGVRRCAANEYVFFLGPGSYATASNMKLFAASWTQLGDDAIGSFSGKPFKATLHTDYRQTTQ